MATEHPDSPGSSGPDRTGANGSGPGDGSDSSLDETSPQPPYAVGDLVRLARVLPYLKSADPMPMLRPPDLLDQNETGQVVEIRALDRLAVRFRRGTFLINSPDLSPADPSG